ncbi:MAG: CDP-diacylglycerol--glycerol-3-phosphate 3-phosphatidyltransferase [Bacteroidota bacterium]
MRKIELQLNLPNQLTLLRVLLTPVFAFLIVSESSLNKQIALIVFVIAAVTDWYDGWVARKFGYISTWGKFLDPLADKILSSAALLVYVGLGLVDAWMVWIIIFRDFLITGLRSYAEFKDQPIVTSKSAQAKTFGQFVVIYYILILYVAKNVPPVYDQFRYTIDTLMQYEVLFGMMLLVTLSTLGTGIAYLFDNRKFLRELYASFTNQNS